MLIRSPICTYEACVGHKCRRQCQCGRLYWYALPPLLVWPGGVVSVLVGADHAVGATCSLPSPHRPSTHSPPPLNTENQLSTYPRAASKLLINFLIFQISTFLSALDSPSDDMVLVQTRFTLSRGAIWRKLGLSHTTSTQSDLKGRQLRCPWCFINLPFSPLKSPRPFG